MWVRGKELIGEDRQTMAYITLVATTIAMNGDKSKTMFPSLLSHLGGEGEYDPGEWAKDASDSKLKFMFGSRFQGQQGEQE